MLKSLGPYQHVISQPPHLGFMWLINPKLCIIVKRKESDTWFSNLFDNLNLKVTYWIECNDQCLSQLQCQPVVRFWCYSNKAFLYHHKHNGGQFDAPIRGLEGTTSFGQMRLRLSTKMTLGCGLKQKLNVWERISCSLLSTVEGCDTEGQS